MSASSAWSVHESPIGPLTVIAGPDGIANIHFDGHAPRLPAQTRQLLPSVTAQLDSYFTGELREFDLDLDLHGNALQLAVWERLLQIPYGSTTTYGEVAAAIDESLYDPGLEPYRRARVVGAAIGRNPVPVIVPCHRVIGADGSLTGFFGGLERKRLLLELEGAGSWAPDSAGPDPQLALL